MHGRVQGICKQLRTWQVNGIYKLKGLFEVRNSPEQKHAPQQVMLCTNMLVTKPGEHLDSDTSNQAGFVEFLKSNWLQKLI